MKQFRSSFLAALALACAPISIGQGTDRDIVDTALTVHKFNLFLSLSRDADLTFVLKDGGPWTVFIPSNEAIEAKYTKAQLDALRGNRPRLRTILLHHVVKGRVDAVSAAKAKWLHPVDGAAIPTAIIGGRGEIGGAKFWLANVQAKNGVIHGIDRVLVP